MRQTRRGDSCGGIVHGQVWAIAAGLAALLLLVPACRTSTEPISSVNPHLQFLSDGLGTNLRDGGTLFIVGYPSDTAFRLSPNRRVPVVVTTSSGDSEQVGLYSRWCPPRDRYRSYNCFRFSIMMREGAHAESLRDHVRAAGGRFFVISVSGDFASVTVFSPDRLVRRARQARSWPGVLHTGLIGPGCQADAFLCAWNSQLALPLPVDEGTPIPGDGIVQVTSGDEVTVTYQQPGGGMLELRLTAP